jgi:hypothetical protein
MRARRFIPIGVATVLLMGVVLAQPSTAAPEKMFSLNVPASVQGGATGVQYLLKFKNETPSGNSNIQSLKATVTDGLTITNATAPSGNVTFTANQVSISNMGPIKPGRTFVVTLTVNIAAGDCGASVTWSAGAWTGTAFGGSAFRLLETEINPQTGLPYSHLVTILGGDCEVRFVPGREPANAIKNDTITSADGSTVQAELLQGGVRVTSFNGTVTITASSAPSGAALSGNSVSASAGLASFPALSADTGGDYTVHASALGLDSDPASFTIFDDGIFCGDMVTKSGEDTTVEITRTDDGAADGCQEIPYTLTVSRTLVQFLKDDVVTKAQDATFQVVITWADPVGQYPNFGTTMIDIDGNGPVPAFVPDNCVVIGGVAQYPENPNGNGYYPDPGTNEPWCVAAVDIHPVGNILQATETLLGSNDPNFQRS